MGEDREQRGNHMADDAQGTIVRGIDWRSTFPFTLIFRSFRVAIHPSKLILALLAMILIYSGGRVLDWWCLATPQHRALPNEMLLYMETRGDPAPTSKFNQRRNEQFELNDQLFKRQLQQIGKPNGNLGDIKDSIIAERNKQVANIRADCDRVPAEPAKAKYDAGIVRDERIKDAY